MEYIRQKQNNAFAKIWNPVICREKVLICIETEFHTSGRNKNSSPHSIVTGSLVRMDNPRENQLARTSKNAPLDSEITTAQLKLTHIQNNRIGIRIFHLGNIPRIIHLELSASTERWSARNGPTRPPTQYGKYAVEFAGVKRFTPPCKN